MRDKPLKNYLRHMIGAARDAIEFTRGLDQSGFLHDKRTQQAVVMSLVVIGEISAKIMDKYPAFVTAHPAIEWRKMRGMRNRIAHDYFEVDQKVVWRTVQAMLPDLISALTTLSDEENPT